MEHDDAVRSDVASPEARVGTIVRDKWRIDDLLGVGGMACVYSATHVNGRRAALKILHPEVARDPVARDRFLREGQIGNKIPHPGRVEVLDHDVTDRGEPFLVMELLHGETLDQLWKRNDRKLPCQTALAVAEQLLDFLAACHSVGIVHRDLKPANVFICDDPSGAQVGRVKVLDYGIAQLRDAQSTEHTRAGTTLGTPSYMSPEQARGSGEKLDGRADIFSVGALLHALVTGTRLHQGRSNDEALILAATQPAQSIARIDPDLPHAVIALIDKALQWDRRNRWENAAQMREAVLRALDDIERPSSLSRVASARPAFEAPSVNTVHERPSSIPPDGDIQLARARSWFKNLERLLPSVRQYGWSHPETERRLRQLFEETLAAHAESPDTIAWSVRPYSFARGERDVWEPAPPLDAIPYALFESGIREVRITPGVSEPELRAFVELLVLDPIRDVAPEDDVATLLWELGLPHVKTQAIEGFFEGDATEREAFCAQSDPLERLAAHAAKSARAEARAMSITTERSALDAADPVSATLGIDRTHRLALGAQLVLPIGKWSERFVDVLADAYLETRARGDAELVLGALRGCVRELSATSQTHLATALHAGWMDALSVRAAPEDVNSVHMELTDAMFGGDALGALCAAIGATARGGAERSTWIAEATPIFAYLGPSSLARVLDVLASAEVEELRPAMLAYVERCIEGHEQLVAARVAEVPQDLARELLAILGRRQTANAASALADVATTGDLALRVEAIAQRADSPERLKQELAALVEDARPEVRIAALRAVADRHVRDLGPSLVRRIEDLGYHALPVEERRALLNVLHALNPARAESLAIEILSQRSVLRGDAREQSRLVAAKLLGENARSREALDALNGAAKGWWGTSSELRSAAMEAAQSVAARIEPPRGTAERGR